MILSTKDKRLLACVTSIEALTILAKSDLEVAMQYKKKDTPTYVEWEMIGSTLDEIMAKIEWISDKMTEHTNQEFIKSVLKMSHNLLANAELTTNKLEE